MEDGLSHRVRTNIVIVEGRRVVIHQWPWRGKTEFWIQGLQNKIVFHTTDAAEVLKDIKTIVRGLRRLDPPNDGNSDKFDSY